MTESFITATPWARFGVGLAATLVLSWACMRWVAPLGWMDHPRGRRQHTRPTPRTGGMALLMALGIGQSTGLVHLPLGWPEWALIYSMGLMGILDDRFDLRARWKAIFSLALAMMLAGLTWDFLLQAGDRLPLFWGELTTRSALAVFLLVAWYWAVPQACNLIDGMNGLAIGFFLLLAVSMNLAGGPSAYGAFLVGGLTALAILNWPRGLQFLGDSGSLALGLLFAILGVKLLAAHSLNDLLWAFAYPIVDVLMVMAIRIKNGRPLGEGDRNHFHHQWQGILGPRRNSLCLALTLLPAVACMQMIQHYPRHQTVAWAGAAWLLVTGFRFYLHGTSNSIPQILPLRTRERMPSVTSGEVSAFNPSAENQDARSS